MASRNTQHYRNTTTVAYDRYGNPIRRSTGSSYQHGNTVRKVKEKEQRGYDYYQERRYREEFEKKEQNRRMKRKQFLQKKKDNALSFTNLIVIAIGSAATVAMCICYLSLMSAISNQSTTLHDMQNELVTLQEENSARYNHLNNSMSLEEVRERAVNSLGMVNATADQIITYEDPSSDYVTQNDSIPK